MNDSKNLVEPNGAGITNTIGRADLAATAAALTHKDAHVATDSLNSLHLRKQILYLEKHRQHVQGDVLKTVSNLARTSQDKVAKYRANFKDNNLTNTGIPSTGPGGKPLYNIPWLAREEARPIRFKTSTSLVCPLPECHNLDSALHILSGYQCPVIRNIVIERHIIASIMILKVVGEGSYGSNLLQMDVDSANRLAQHDLHITEQV
eukprot:1152675-Pelagomonas_calceolata.AAC.3